MTSAEVLSEKMAGGCLMFLDIDMVAIAVVPFDPGGIMPCILTDTVRVSGRVIGARGFVERSPAFARIYEGGQGGPGKVHLITAGPMGSGAALEVDIRRMVRDLGNPKAEPWLWADLAFRALSPATPKGGRGL